ncbi:MAG: hypothetical protein KGZ25_14820, partial [Planctomycetes bacterium]|nr:hypothetical protein [Planctomycetota bacterium]
GRKLIFQEASRRGIKIPEEQIKNQQFKMAESIFSERASAEGMSARRYEAKLRDQGIPPELLKEKIARELVSREIVETVLLADKLVGKPKNITNSEIKKAYKSLYEEHLNVRRIVVDDPARARWVRSRVFSDVRFETLVRAESLEPLSWMHGGLVKGITTGDPYYKYVQNLEVGQVSPIFRHNGNFHIAKVVARFNPTDPPPMEEVQDKVKARAEELKTRKRIKAWVQKIKAESEINVKL